MTWLRIQQRLIEIALWLWAHWYILIAILGILLVLFVMNWVDSCRTRQIERKIDDIKTNITVDKVESNIQSNIVNQAANNSNQALENVNKAANRDSSNHPADFNEAKKKFCAEFPNDSLCKK
jgi:hypothetical protein